MGSRAPFLVAHRAGNDLALLRAAEGACVGLVEADVRRYRGRLEVRHLKTLGPVPVLWDRWALASARSPRLVLADLLAATATQTELMLDLKGRDRRLATGVLGALRPYLGSRAFTVCARSWPLLTPFDELHGVRAVHSVGNAKQLRRLLRSVTGRRLQGVSIHERLLDAGTVAELRRVSDLVLTWPANAVARARELLALGVDGLITDRLELARELPLRAGAQA